MSDLDLEALAQEVGRRVGCVERAGAPNIDQHGEPYWEYCPGCRAKAAALAALQRAVEAEREACAITAMKALSFHSYAGGVAAAAIRARGGKP